MDPGALAVASEEHDGTLVRAAGGVIVRVVDGRTQLAVVHRPHRFDWTFPKGKVEPGESLEDGARREVLEETGLHCRLGRFVGHTEYQDRKDRPKVVAYWLMTVDGGHFAPNAEVDELRWLEPASALEVLTYERDRELLASVTGMLEEGSTAA